MATQFDQNIHNEFCSKLFTIHGTNYRISRRDIIEQNGMVDRKHRNITEVCLKIMLHAHVPK